jgi:predicted nucleic-acid-binding Zn-ribbon protein
MKNGICPRCGSNEVLSNLRVRGGEGHPPYVDIHEPEPEKRPFVWIPKSEQSHFRAYICGACGYTEFYAENYAALNEGRKKGYSSG